MRGNNRFVDVQQRVGADGNVLNQRLSRLIEVGVLTKVPTASTHRDSTTG
jgi:hypothetical protein